MSVQIYELSSVAKVDLTDREEISRDLYDSIVNRPTERDAQSFLRAAYNDHKWLRCTCAEGVYLAIRRTTNFFCLVRLTGPERGEHADDCVFSEGNMPIYRKNLAEKLKTKALSFHINRSAVSETPTKAAISVKGLQAESTRLARFMFTLYEEAGLNKIDLRGDNPNISAQYKAIREAANSYTIAGKGASQVLYTHPKDIERAVSSLTAGKWADNQVPQVLLFLIIDSIAGKTLQSKVGEDRHTIKLSSKVEYFFDDASPPYNILATLALRQHSETPEVLRCVALPVFSKAFLLPVKSDAVRQFIKTLVQLCKKGRLNEATLLTPFFPQFYEDYLVRPDFSIEMEEESKVLIYFLSRKDESIDARRGEIDFLRSTGIIVYTFDLDKERTDLSKDLYFAAKHFFEEYLEEGSEDREEREPREFVYDL